MSTQYLTVSALTKYIKRKFDADPYLERVYLTGEVSNYRRRPNHQYFSIKDDHAVISAVMYRHEFNRLKFQLQDGMKILLIGRVSVYEPGGNYNIVIEHMEPDGIGALFQAYTELKEKLTKEGLFSLPKKPLPRYPKKIAIVTSPSGAVIRDIMTTIKRRYPIVQLELYPTVVQGKESAESIVKNLKKIKKAGDYDLAIIGRGGGSIEDLWSFNEEAVIRQIIDMDIPIISSVGHETDTTLSDLAADVRAATPTAAAELSVPVLAEVLQEIKMREQRLYQTMRSKLALRQEMLNRFMRSYVFRQPNRLYEGHLVRLDQYTSRLQNNVMQTVQSANHRQHQLALRLQNTNPINQIKVLKRDWHQLDEDLHQSMQRYIDSQQQSLHHMMESLDLLSPLKIMARGYSYVTVNDTILTSTDEVEVGQAVSIYLENGQLEAQITAKKEKNDGRNERN
ncbi:exodeoxyribonuclease VII large subunit [Jeotgalibaca caeni]|uniref:exodeoxyribonuclease VII large subunit n=1 Tax=Jeotgalibaca caeni TaxID=3028623 RepID=UPI00237EAE36|nr:exodeoxyribonuclease VII large subunit [Jeotgalibaca caeni]MDE1547846.1 exodeoxyribonuclease VII large subunit [Jeotgalibaca caeni]